MAKEKVLNGVRFAVAPFTVTEALSLKIYIGRLFGPSLGQTFGALKDGLPLDGKIGDIKIDGSALSDAIAKLLTGLTETEFMIFLKRMFRNVVAHTTKEQEPLQITFTETNFDASMDVVFKGKIFSIYPVIALVLEANYPDFFEGLAHGIGAQIKKIATSVQEKPGSTNESESSAK